MIDIVTFARAIDWEGLYYNGVLQVEGHRIDVEKALDVVNGRPLFEIEIIRVDSDWLDEIGYLPRNLDKVKIDERP